MRSLRIRSLRLLENNHMKMIVGCSAKLEENKASTNIAVLKNFAIFRGKHFCVGVFLKKCCSPDGLQLY